MVDAFLELPTARLAYDVDERDGGRTLVVLHGLTGSRAADDASLIFGTTQLADVRQRVVRYDARGHGRSTGRPKPDDWRWSALAGDLLALLDAVAPGEQVDVLGISMGTGTALAAAVREPQRFRRMVLTIPPTAWGTRERSRVANEAAADLVERDGLGALDEPEPPIPVLEEGGWPDPGIDMVEALVPSILRGAARSDLPPAEAVAELPAPALLLPWAGDSGHPVDTAERLHGLLRNSELHVAQRADDIRGWARRVAAFLSD